MIKDEMRFKHMLKSRILLLLFKIAIICSLFCYSHNYKHTAFSGKLSENIKNTSFAVADVLNGNFSELGAHCIPSKPNTRDTKTCNHSA